MQTVNYLGIALYSKHVVFWHLLTLLYTTQEQKLSCWQMQACIRWNGALITQVCETTRGSATYTEDCPSTSGFSTHINVFSLPSVSGGVVWVRVSPPPLPVSPGAVGSDRSPGLSPELHSRGQIPLPLSEGQGKGQACLLLQWVNSLSSLHIF